MEMKVVCTVAAVAQSCTVVLVTTVQNLEVDMVEKWAEVTVGSMDIVAMGVMAAMQEIMVQLFQGFMPALLDTGMDLDLEGQCMVVPDTEVAIMEPQLVMVYPRVMVGVKDMVPEASEAVLVPQVMVVLKAMAVAVGVAAAAAVAIKDTTIVVL